MNRAKAEPGQGENALVHQARDLFLCKTIGLDVTLANSIAAVRVISVRRQT
jgi:hypothetical protein